ncbi:MAG TPA: hypothetical protein DEP05_02525 [Betaproteobacteria bacterium]|nr:hypothetical protein [Betaproteobacteria bacterium]
MGGGNPRLLFPRRRARRHWAVRNVLAAPALHGGGFHVRENNLSAGFGLPVRPCRRDDGSMARHERIFYENDAPGAGLLRAVGIGLTIM